MWLCPLHSGAWHVHAALPGCTLQRHDRLHRLLHHVSSLVAPWGDLAHQSAVAGCMRAGLGSEPFQHCTTMMAQDLVPLGLHQTHGRGHGRGDRSEAPGPWCRQPGAQGPRLEPLQSPSRTSSVGASDSHALSGWLVQMASVGLHGLQNPSLRHLIPAQILGKLDSCPCGTDCPGLSECW